MALKTELLKKLTEDDWVLVTYDIKGRYYTDENEKRKGLEKKFVTVQLETRHFSLQHVITEIYFETN